MPFFFAEYNDGKGESYHHNIWAANKEAAIESIRNAVGDKVEVKLLSSEGETSRERLYKAWINSFGVSKRDLPFPYWLSNGGIKELMLLYLKKGYGWWLTGRARADAIRNIKNIVIYKEDRKSRSRNKYNFKREKLYLDALEESIEILENAGLLNENGRKRG